MLTIFAALGAAPPAGAQLTADAAIAAAKAVVVDDGCQDARGGQEIVVCGRRVQGDSYRLPLPTGESAGSGPVRGEVPNASPDRLAGGACGIFQGDRSCGKAEMLRYGYGGGRDPVTLLIKLGTILADADAIVADPVALPMPVQRSR